jgi:tetratricopeptide (TPR) repeat protein
MVTQLLIALKGSPGGMRRGRRRLAEWALALGGALCATFPAAAQVTKQQYDAAFQEMVRDLSNPDKSFRFAQTAVEYGDVKGAIAALERLLVLNPTLNNIRLELGLLYLREGAPNVAKAYLDAALADPSMPAEVKARAERLAAEGERRLSRHLVVGSAYAGAKYETNVNSAPSSPNVRAAGLPAQLRNEDLEDEDASIFALGRLRHSYDLLRQSGDRIETNLLAYVSRQDERPDYDLDLFELDAGPWLGLDALGLRTLRPFVIASHLGLERKTYRQAFGGGLTYQHTFSEWLLGELTARHIEQDFEGSRRRPLADDESGGESTLRASAYWRTSAMTTLTLTGAYLRDNAERDSLANHDYGVGAEFSVSYPALFGGSEPWVTSAGAEFRRIEYDEADAAVDPAVRRRDDRLELSLVTSVPLLEATALLFTLQWTDNDSNLPNFTYDNTAVIVGVSRAF